MISIDPIADAVSLAGVRLTTFAVTAPTRVIRLLQAQTALTVTLPVRTQDHLDYLTFLLASVANTPVVMVDNGSTHDAVDMHLNRIGRSFNAAREATMKELGKWRGCRNQPLPAEMAEEMLAPWLHRTALVTATEWKELVALRTISPEIAQLLDIISMRLKTSVPHIMQDTHYYIPFLGCGDIEKMALHAFEDASKISLDAEVLENCVTHLCVKLAIARCARYANGDHTPTTVRDDLALFDRLLVEGTYLAYAGHIAVPDSYVQNTRQWRAQFMHGNLVGWCQYRKQLIT